ncbi:MAG: hypothetical protein U0W40_00680 [Acidimicrobiia bacterium]
MTQPTADRRVHLSARDVVVEAFPDETVAVNLGTGHYYSLDLPSTAVFDLAVTGQSAEAITSAPRDRARRRPGNGGARRAARSSTSSWPRSWSSSWVTTRRPRRSRRPSPVLRPS